MLLVGWRLINVVVLSSTLVWLVVGVVIWINDGCIQFSMLERAI